MIQRLQSLYLLFNALLGLGYVTFNIELAGYITDIGGEKKTLTIGSSFIKNSLVSAGIELNIWSITSFLLLSIYSFFLIFMYKNLEKQLRYVRLNFIAIIIGLSGIFFSVIFAINGDDSTIDLNFSKSLFLTLLTLFFNFLAYRGIKRDIALIGSADRLR
ncbi:MAG: DUF4293 family protein [bacterium]|nr:DUF4293 family protein [bacterium]